jgi:hypothetical protein
MKDSAKSTTPSARRAGCHKIKSVELVGGFLDGVKLELDETLNCIIGGRGTGKTSVLEAIRYALDRMGTVDKSRQQMIERLLEHNMSSGSVRLEIETRDGVAYTVTRGLHQVPVVTGAGGAPVDVNLKKDIVFGVEIFSQSQIEDIAGDPFSQLALLDKFVSTVIDVLNEQIRETAKQLESNATKILEARRAIADLADATRELPDVTEKIRGIDHVHPRDADDVVRKQQDLKVRRGRELEIVDATHAMCARGVEELGGIARELQRQWQETFDEDVASTPNRELVERLRDRAELAVEQATRSADAAAKALQAASKEVGELRAELERRHVTQDKQYRELIDKHEQDRVVGAERLRLQQRHSELKTKGKRLTEKKTLLEALDLEREKLRAQLSDLRDQRFHKRTEVAETLTRTLHPMVRVRIEPFGNTDEYRALLNQAMKGSKLQYASIVDRIIERIPPPELVAMVQGDDSARLQRELDLDVDRALRVIVQLKDKHEIFAIETVELHDRPILELKDGDRYKESSTLSTGQKCTTILPILLIENERPLIIDQPEDNLDNAFVYETIVKSIAAVRGRRQLLFVTHNPNIPVLGDAARVFALQSTGTAASLAKAGSVDDVAQEIMTILEGGRIAFEARRLRYGIPTPRPRATE